MAKQPPGKAEGDMILSGIDIMKPNCTEIDENIGSYRPQTAFGCPRDFLDNRYIYIVISPRARGLAIGINVSPEGRCNFRCAYCEVERPVEPSESPLDLDLMTAELQKTISLVRSGQIREHAAFRNLDSELLELRQVIFSGDGEPTLAPSFAAAVQRVVHVRARSMAAFFKMVLVTNGSGLDLHAVQDALKFFTHHDEVWIKLDAGTQAYMSRINGGESSLNRVLGNILTLGRQRPVGIQSLFPLVDGEEPPEEEIEEYLKRLVELKDGGAQISMVQVYSAARTARPTHCAHLPLKSLFRICQKIKTATGLVAEVF